MAKTTGTQFLKDSILYKNIIPEWNAVIDMGKQIIRVPKGAIIFKEGERVGGVYFLNYGKAKIHQHWGLDKELIIGFAKGGDMLGYRGLGRDKLHHASATALEPMEACFIPTQLLDRTLQINPKLTLALLNSFAQELQDTETRMRNMALMEVKGRVCETLLELRKKFGIDPDNYIDIALTRQDLASYTGTTYETLFRTLQDLTQKKWIKTNGKKISILNEAKLIANIHPR